MINIQNIQSILRKEKIDGWLLYDFRASNSIAHEILELTTSMHLTRRLFYWIPQEGTPVSVVSFVETHVALHLPGDKRVYTSLESMQHCLKEILSGSYKIAMEYSYKNHIPTISKVDAGIMELIQGFGLEITSSGTFLQHLMCIWSDEQLTSHREAAKVLDETASLCWHWISEQLKKERKISEYDVSCFILQEIEKKGCSIDAYPICGVNQNSANPHYTPPKDSSLIIQKGDWILIDLWCKQKKEQSVYADITRVAVADKRPTQKQLEIYQIVRNAQKKATDFVEQKVVQNQSIQGFEVDAVCRSFIQENGYDSYFLHRTGHNIHTENHGPGTNIDGFETFDDRFLLPRTCFSIEPGIYLPHHFGVRQEYDVFIHDNHTIEINGGIQDTIITLF